MDEHPPLTWAVFVDHLARAVPGLPAGPTRSFDVTRTGVLDHAQRTALCLEVRLLCPALQPGRIHASQTLGELFELCARDGSADGPRLTRGAYNTGQVALAPVTPQHIEPIYLASLDPHWSYRWRFRGRTLSPEEFRRALFEGVLAQFVVVDQATGALVGLVVAYEHHPDAGHCSVGFQRTAVAEGPAATVEGLALFIDYLFTTFRLDRIRAEIPEYNLPVLGGVVESLCEIEGRRTAYYWHNSRAWDQLLIALSRERWEHYVAGWITEDARAQANGARR